MAVNRNEVKYRKMKVRKKLRKKNFIIMLVFLLIVFFCYI